MSEPDQREEVVFEAALQLPPEQRAAYLDQACVGDPALRRRVEVLLGALERAGGFLSQPAATIRYDPPITEKAGDRIERYKLLQEIGEGGCGIVYMAEQEQPVRRRVALKIIKLGMDTKQVVARFEAERQALAMMDHPNIAKVLDAGATETGRPYFVMELVRGVPITEYCDKNNLSTHQRLELFLPICKAIQHAHQKGVIHRDIKPSNILVTLHDGVPVPKVIDFGIAKAIDQPLTEKTLFTRFEQFMGTPAYMSPEQAEMSGLDIDTRSDIYALGVLLYELLTGKPPFDSKELAKLGLDEMRRTIREQDPPKPSTRLAMLPDADRTTVAKHRQTEPPKLVHVVRSDLDWIVMKCLEKDRTRRYETVNGVASDVERHLNNEPVVARPPSALYRFQKSVQRNKLAFTAAGAVAVALIVGVIVSSWFAVRAARAEREQSRLRQEAETARAVEATLRHAAEAREKIVSARVLCEDAHYEEAERLLDEIPASSVQPDFEHAALRRVLGTQYAVRGQWTKAAANLALVMQLDRLDPPDSIGLDFLRYGPVLIELGEADRYRQFVQSTVSRCAGTPDPISAERVCKICLLLPADEKVLGRLGALYDVTVGKLNDFTNPQAKRWACISLAITEYRRANYVKAVEWCALSLDDDPKAFATYVATAHVIRSMARYQLNEEATARSDLSRARDMIDGAFKRGLFFGPDNINNIESFDWMYARILLREATTLIESKTAVTGG